MYDTVDGIAGFIDSSLSSLTALPLHELNEEKDGIVKGVRGMLRSERKRKSIPHIFSV